MANGVEPGLRLLVTTQAPSAPIALAMALPMPCPDPVTSATFPFKLSPMFLTPFYIKAKIFGFA
jgi:hypothetical protein